MNISSYQDFYRACMKAGLSSKITESGWAAVYDPNSWNGGGGTVVVEYCPVSRKCTTHPIGSRLDGFHRKSVSTSICKLHSYMFNPSYNLEDHKPVDAVFDSSMYWESVQREVDGYLSSPVLPSTRTEIEDNFAAMAKSRACQVVRCEYDCMVRLLSSPPIDMPSGPDRRSAKIINVVQRAYVQDCLAELRKRKEYANLLTE